ncbi:MAG: hypothetical protein IKV35_04910 [Clostridia bacterium]|nr:hypothetical protein [Clostridia bacterium]
MTEHYKRIIAACLCASLVALPLTGCGNTDSAPDTAATTTVNDRDRTTVTTQTTSTTVQSTAFADETTTSAETETTASTTTPTTSGSVSVAPNVNYFVPPSGSVDVSYFSDAVFVGDSVSLKLTNYHYSTDCLGDATFLTSGSLGVANSMWSLNDPNAVHPYLRGEKVTVVDGIAKSGCSKVYLMLGINDVGLYGVEGTFENFKTLTAKILEKSPNVTFYIQSVTPLHEDYYNVTNARVNQYNTLISEYCREKGWYFVDVASVLRDENGKLPREYCSDPDGMGIHFTDAACQKWVEYLYTHTG